MSPDSPVVLGAAVGYPLEDVAPFVRSLRRSGYDGHMVLLVDPQVAEEYRRSPRFTNVTVISQPRWWPVRHRLFWGRRRWALRFVWTPIHAIGWLAMRAVSRLPIDAAKRRRAQMALALRVFPTTESRYVRFLRVLEEGDFSHALLSDVRDVLFQTDPFAHLPRSGLAVSMEVPQHTISSEGHTAGWVRQGYGESMLERIGGEQVSCSGVTYGDRASIIRYLSSMFDEMLSLPRVAAKSSGMDQGIHNVLLWTGRLGDVHRLEPMSSAVATLGGYRDEDVGLTPDGRVVNADGTVISVLHQYDRFPALRAPLLASLAGVSAAAAPATTTRPRRSRTTRNAIGRIRGVLGRRRRQPLVRRFDALLVQLHEGYENRNYDYNTNGERRVIEIVRSTLGPRVIFDVGANVGGWTAMTASVVPRARIYSFEPVAEAFEELARTMSGNDKLVAVNAALGDSPGEREINYHPQGTGLAMLDGGFSESFHHYDPRRQGIQVTTGDEFCAQRGIGSIDYLKIDVEGYEDRVLRGFDEMLKRGAIKVIQFEYGYTSVATKFLLKDFYELLEPFGMRIGKIYPTYVDFRDYEYSHEDFIGPNFLAVHATHDELIRALS